MKTILKIFLWIFVFILLGALLVDWYFFSTQMPKTTLNSLKGDAVTDSLVTLTKTFQNEVTNILNLNEGEKPREMVITGPQLNAIFNTYLTSTQIVQRNDEQVKITHAEFRDGVLYVSLTFICKIYTPFGRYINVDAGIIPAIDKGFLRLTVRYFKAGRFEIKSINSTFSKHKNEIALEPSVQKLLAAIDKLEFRKDGILIKYYPEKLQGLILNAIGQ